MSIKILLQNYSMDCYFRQYWKDERLKFPPLDLSAHTSQIDQLSLNVAMLEMIWKVVITDSITYENSQHK